MPKNTGLSFIIVIILVMTNLSFQNDISNRVKVLDLNVKSVVCFFFLNHLTLTDKQ